MWNTWMFNLGSRWSSPCSCKFWKGGGECRTKASSRGSGSSINKIYLRYFKFVKMLHFSYQGSTLKLKLKVKKKLIWNGLTCYSPVQYFL